MVKAILLSSVLSLVVLIIIVLIVSRMRKPDEELISARDIAMGHAEEVLVGNVHDDERNKVLIVNIDGDRILERTLEDLVFLGLRIDAAYGTPGRGGAKVILSGPAVSIAAGRKYLESSGR